MASKLFSTKSNGSLLSNKPTKTADTINEAGGKAYSLDDKAALAQLVVTGCFNNTFYTKTTDQLDKVLELAQKVEPEYLAKLAVYARKNGMMKDSPAVLLAVLAKKNVKLFSRIFSQVVDNPKMVRNFVQIMRSGISGSKSMGTRPKKMVQQYLESLTDEQLFKADVGNSPSLPDIIKMVHPKPKDNARSAMYGYLLGKDYKKEDLAEIANKFESFKKDMGNDIPNVPFQMLTALPLTESHWKSIAENATWTQVRMNLNTFARHNVFSDLKLVNKLCNKLSDREQVLKANVFPYQLFTAYQYLDSAVPNKLGLALQDAAEIAIENVSDFGGKKVYVLVDVSRSMNSSATGNRGSVTSKTRCIDVAALFAASILRKNKDAEVIPFDTQVHDLKLNSYDSIMTNAKIFSKFNGGGTDCSCALRYLNSKKLNGDLVIMISDNQSWFESENYYHNATSSMLEWNSLVKRNPQAKLVNIDITPSKSTQTHERDDVLNIGGFSDQIFEVISRFSKLGSNKDMWIETIEAVEV